MRLVLYVKGFPPRETGGPAEVACHVSRELLRDRNVALTLVVQSDSTEGEIRDVLGGNGSLRVLRLPYYPTPREMLALGPVLRAFASADVIHFNEFPFRHLPLVVLAKARGVPVVFSLHGLLSREIDTFLGPSYPVRIREGDGSISLRVQKAGVRALVSAYRSFARAWTAVVVPSEALKRGATSLERFPVARILVIPHGVEGSDVPSKGPVASGGRIRVLFVGKLETVKGPDLLLEAVGRLVAADVPVDLSIVGSGSLEDRLRARAKDLAPSRVTFLGVRRGTELRAFYSASDIVVVPSRTETLSMVVLEAMAAGRPVLATDVGGIPEILREPRNGLLVRPDPDALADGLRRLIEDPSLRASMAEANLADAHRRSWETVVDRYVELYAGLMSRAKVSRADPV